VLKAISSTPSITIVLSLRRRSKVDTKEARLVLAPVSGRTLGPQMCLPPEGGPDQSLGLRGPMIGTVQLLGWGPPRAQSQSCPNPWPLPATKDIALVFGARVCRWSNRRRARLRGRALTEHQGASKQKSGLAGRFRAQRCPPPWPDPSLSAGLLVGCSARVEPYDPANLPGSNCYTTLRK